MENKKKIILDNVKDLVSNFLYYNRKEDEELQVGDIENQIKSGNITFDEIINCFAEELKQTILNET